MTYNMNVIFLSRASRYKRPSVQTHWDEIREDIHTKEILQDLLSLMLQGAA